MNSRFATNLLLAVIAGVLLFGRDWMMSSFRNGMILLAVIAVLFAIFWIIWWPIRSFIEALREADGVSGKAETIMGALFALCLVPLFGYAGLLWLNGTNEPLEAAIASPLGIVWICVLIGGAGLMALIALYGKLGDDTRQSAVTILRKPAGALRKAGGWYSNVLAAAVDFPMMEWERRKANGSGLVVRVAASTVAWLVGALVSFVGLMLTALLITGILFGLSSFG